jgi:hypothetical protein
MCDGRLLGIQARKVVVTGVWGEERGEGGRLKCKGKRVSEC